MLGSAFGFVIAAANETQIHIKKKYVIIIGKFCELSFNKM